MDSYTKLRVLGEGAYGRVYLARGRRPPRRLVCVKQLFASVPQTASQNEIRLLQRVRHPNIVRILDASTKCIVLEFCPGGDLRGFLQQRPPPVIHEDRVWYWIVQLCLALHCLDSHKIWHRDLKTSNVFLGASGFLVLGDLGVAREASPALASTVIGTPLYMAPEIWDGHPYDGACDLWALGCTIYEICTGKTPFQDAPSTPALIKRACEAKYSRLPSAKWSSRLRTLVRELLSVNPTKRPTAATILQMPESRVYIQRYVHDRIHANCTAAAQESEDQAILHAQLQSLRIVVDPPATPTSTATVSPTRKPTVSEGEKFQQLEREQRQRAQREHERHEQLQAALRRMHELQQKDEELHQHVVKPCENAKPSSRVAVAAVDPEWKAPVQATAVKRPSSASPTPRTRVAPAVVTGPIAFRGIPRAGVPVTRQAHAFAAKSQSPLCHDVRVLRKQESSKAAARYKADLDDKFNPKKQRDQVDEDLADGLAQLEAQLRAQLETT